MLCWVGLGRVGSGRCIETATAVCVPAGVVSVSAEPSSWHTGVVLVGVVVGVVVVLQFLVPPPLRTQVVHHMPRRVSLRVRPNTSTPLSGSHVPSRHDGLLPPRPPLSLV